MDHIKDLEDNMWLGSNGSHLYLMKLIVIPDIVTEYKLSVQIKYAFHASDCSKTETQQNITL